MITDVLKFPDDQPPVNLVFGCVNGERGELYRQMADGLMGMGNNHNAFQSQLVANGIIDDVFSLCFGFPRNGVLLLGDVPLPEALLASTATSTVYTPLISSMHLHFYNVRIEGIEVKGERLPLDPVMFDRGYGTVLDSGTTFTYLPSLAFEAMSRAVGQYAEERGLQRTPGADPQYNDICWKGASDNVDALLEFFPYAEFVLGGDVRLKLPPVRYLFLSRPGEYCLSVFDNGGSGTLIGTGSVQNVLVTVTPLEEDNVQLQLKVTPLEDNVQLQLKYDRRNSRVGFTDIDCEELASALVATANATAASSPSPPPPFPAPPSPPPPPPSPSPPPRASRGSRSSRGSPSPAASRPHPHMMLHHKHHHPSGGGSQLRKEVAQRSHWLRLR
ncbi:hypothetical protein VOLCADRAFT_108309 [Volvox carteri f. nagariensis]|uniref:Peptidase A1 domain-containing protein n=1 Tax=Volvox carteri f. nagariensis TaxID=3068 RepID=D8UJD8_VOLCA|nr:uncharacterized protein VOLCADRAFT_108309 [Volvox carteri f. nagariensis]EFJ40170.1 hypothetical protein VOLCADRAFT_108309 [Volvox carteri f. nagariensis]|eukprot:XP_002958780.1 hypothetical protein VOLCADRAFT_108309 [Volvox carteri f. nagariensis]